MDQILHFVTGKGGVGKSTIAYALAKKFADQGESTLLVELGHRSYFSHFLGKRDFVEYTEKEIQENLSVCLWDGKAALREYVEYFLRSSKLVNTFFDVPFMSALIDAGPSLQELAILGKITSGIRNTGPDLKYKNIVVDGYSTGHHLALFNAPKGMIRAMAVGPVNTESKAMLEVISNPQCSKHYTVTLPEELPVQETIELNESLRTEFSIDSRIILNKVEGFNGAKTLGDTDFEREIKIGQSRTDEARARLSHGAFEVPFVYLSDQVKLGAKISEYLGGDSEG
jgi:hypothetical protein